jgi:uncharacterized C2H2 Zn-finger protein
MLFSAVQAAELIDTLRGPGPFTIFAPDDQAFTKLSPGTVDELLKNVPKLKAVLMYHVVAGKLTINEISQMETAKTIQGQEIKIDAHKWHLHMNLKINDANITNYDIVANNGMIHVLDKVLMPNMELTCPICGMGFMTMEALKAHTEMGHVAEKTPEPVTTQAPQRDRLHDEEPNMILCPDCGKPFKTNMEMQRHRDATHHETKGHEY